ncbi:anti-sigma factor family protein [Lysobacter terrae]
MTGRPITEDDLHAYVDGSLDSERHVEVSAYLDQHPDVAQRVSDYRWQREHLRSAFLDVAQEPVPANLNLEHMVVRRRRPRWVALPTAAAAMLLIGLGGIGGWLSHSRLRPAPAGIEALAQEATDSYEVHASDRVRPVELRANDRDELVRWASERLGRPVTIPDLSGSGYRFMGGRLVATEHGPAVLFMYDDDRGTRLVMLSRRMVVDQNIPMKLHLRGSVAGFTWANRGIGYSLVGSMAANLLHPIANEVRRQLELET